MSATQGHPAIFLPWSSAYSPESQSKLAARYEFVLVADQTLYSQLVEVGGQPILVSRGFSETDTRGRYRLKLGALIVPWRWRRVLMNENIDRLTVLTGRGAIAVIGGALLAGVRWRLLVQ